MLIRRHSGGGRMQNYFPLPVRYDLAPSSDEDDYAPRIAGFVFITTGVLAMARPLTSYLGFEIDLMFPARGAYFIPWIPDGNAWAPFILGAAFFFVGVRVVSGSYWARWLAIALTVLCFFLLWPLAVLMIYELWPKKTAFSASSPAPE